jgi:outer membrane protein assembly factor BamB
MLRRELTMFKKCISLMVIIVSVLSLSYSTSGATDDIIVKINNVALSSDDKPLILEGRTLLPLRAIFEALNIIVNWDNTTKTVTAETEDITIVLQINNKTALINGNEVELDVPAQIINNRTYVPVRFIAESVGASVDWDSSTRTVLIEYKILFSQGKGFAECNYDKNAIQPTMGNWSRQSRFGGVTEPEQKWSLDLESTSGGFGFHRHYSPVIGSDGTIYVGSTNGKLYAVNPDGSIKWTYQTEGSINYSPSIGTGGIIYVVSGSTNLYAINSDGTLKWLYKTFPEETNDFLYTIKFAPVINDTEEVVLVLGDKLLGIDNEGNSRTIIEGNYYCTPVVYGSNGEFYISSAGEYEGTKTVTLECHYPAGECSKDWVITSFDEHNIFSEASESSPVFDVTGNLYFIENIYQQLVSINTNVTMDNELFFRWSLESYETLAENTHSPLAISNKGVIYIAPKKSIFGPDKNGIVKDWNEILAINSDGTLKWTAYIEGYPHRSGLMIDKYDNIYVCAYYYDMESQKPMGYIYCISEDGGILWDYKVTEGGLSSSFAMGEDGTIYTCTDTGMLLAIGNKE